MTTYNLTSNIRAGNQDLTVGVTVLTGYTPSVGKLL